MPFESLHGESCIDEGFFMYLKRAVAQSLHIVPCPGWKQQDAGVIVAPMDRFEIPTFVQHTLAWSSWWTHSCCVNFVCEAD